MPSILNLRLLLALTGSCLCLSAASIRPGVTPNPVDARLRDGFRALDRGLLPDAERAFQAELVANPKRVEAMLGLAEISRFRGQRPQTESWLRKAIATQPKNPLPHRSFAHYLAGTNRTSEAAAEFRVASGVDANSSVALVELAEMELMAGRVAPALGAFQEAVTKTPDSFEAHMGLGASLLASRRKQDAVVAFQRASSINPKSAEPHLSLGLLHAEFGERDAAVVNLTAALRLDPLLYPAYLARGDMYQAAGSLPQAVSDYTAVIKANSRSGAGHLRLGFLYLGQKRTDDAERSFRSAVDIEPTLAPGWNNLAWLAAERKTNLDKALEWAQKAVALRPKDVSFADTLAWVYRARGEAGQAVKTLEAIPPALRTPIISYHLGLIEAERGRNAEAAVALQRSLAGAPFAEADAARKLLSAVSK